MKNISLGLEPVNGYLLSITRNTIKGWYEIEVGLPSTWVFDENNKINCELLNENDAGKLIKISPKKNDVLIDDLISFVEIIIHTNKKIAEKELQFSNKMQEMKGLLEKEAKTFYKELEEIKINSFKNINESFAKNLNKPRKPRTTKVKVNPSQVPNNELLELDENKKTSNLEQFKSPGVPYLEKDSSKTVTEETTIESNKKD